MDNETKGQSKSEKSLHELLDSPTVEVYVGSENTRWPLPEKLLCYHSPVFAEAFEKDSKDDKKKSYALDDEEDATFRLLIAYFYSQSLPPVYAEKTVGPLLDLYLLALRLKIDSLCTSVVDAVREWYHQSSTYPGLRRVQYIYANTDEDNEMREMMVSSVARQLTTGESIPAHWATALQRNGQLAVDIIRSIQHWHIEEKSIPDVRDSSSGRDRKTKGGFSAVEREGDESADTTMADSAIGLESQDGDAEEQTKGKADTDNLENMHEVAAEACGVAWSTSIYATPAPLDLSSLLILPEEAQLQNLPPPDRPPKKPRRNRRSSSNVTFSSVDEIVPFPVLPEHIDERGEPEEDDGGDNNNNDDGGGGGGEDDQRQVVIRQPQEPGTVMKILRSVFKSQEAGLLILLWMIYVAYMFDLFAASKKISRSLWPIDTTTTAAIFTTRHPANTSIQLRRFGLEDWAV